MTHPPAFRFFGPTEKALYLSRPNRFVLTCKLGEKTVNAFLPNPGRLSELLLPGTPIYIEKTSNPNRSLRYTAVALEREGLRIVLHTHKTNEVARYLIESGSVPALSGHEVVRGEVTRGNSRFDFLLTRDGKEMLLEVKSCTLFSKMVAMFPDAVTARGKKHLEELTRLSADGTSCAVLFLVHWPRAEVFLPDFHTDLEFARAMKGAKDKVRFFPVSVEWGEDLSIVPGRTRVLPVLWEALEREAEDRGSYLILYRLPRKRLIEIGGLGKVTFKQGYYIYVGSAMKSLSKRVERHRRIRKKLHWHIDYFSSRCGLSFESSGEIRGRSGVRACFSHEQHFGVVCSGIRVLRLLLPIPPLRLFHRPPLPSTIPRRPPVLPNGPAAGEIPTSHHLIGRPRNA